MTGNQRRSYLLQPGQTYVMVPARIAALVESRTDISALRVRTRGVDPEATAVLEDHRVAALSWTANGTRPSEFPEVETDDDKSRKPATESDWLSARQAGDLANVTRQAITKAAGAGRLHGTKVDGRWRISRADLEHWKASRPYR
jgi:excisionase family DNA binding protein